MGAVEDENERSRSKVMLTIPVPSTLGCLSQTVTLNIL